MYSILIISILFELAFISCTYLEAEANYKPQVERNNIVNKGIWVRNKSKTNLFDKTSLGDVVFRPNSLDADRLIQTNYEPFADNAMEESPFLPSFKNRKRRAAEQIGNDAEKKKQVKSNTDNAKTLKSMTDQKHSSIFTNYPYEVAIVLNNNRKDLIEAIHNGHNNTINNKTSSNENSPNIDNVINVVQDTATGAETDVSVPKRDKKHNYSIDEPINIINDIKKTDIKVADKPNRNAYDNKGVIWHQDAPIPDSNIYQVVNKVVTKEKSKGVSERSLLKVISALTKSFKKIIKQHNEVKDIYNKFKELNDDFTKEIAKMNTKFQDFDSKYSDMIMFNDKLKIFEDKLTNEDEFVTNKHNEWQKFITEFHNQQKQFLSQQKQFYTIQKVMLAQNENINQKQSTIAKAQSEISLRQNNFARILKKAKQLFFNNNKINKSQDDQVPSSKYHEDQYKVIDDIHDTRTEYTTTPVQTTTENIKLNLFSIPTKAKLINQDDLIIKEKDDRPVDELVYKFYFNNTLIDNLMKSKILNGFTTNSNSIEIARSAKNKRDELDTTILYPVINKDHNANRVRRWLNNWNSFALKDDKAKVDNKNEHAKSDPFFTMASSFCNEIGQNRDEQSYKWCIEKALRRLRFMDKKLFSKPSANKDKKPQIVSQVSTTPDAAIKLPPTPQPTVLVTSDSVPVTTQLPITNQTGMFFPDNEELEDNLKQFDLTPDTEGNVYYDGSLHLSDIEHIAHASDGISVFGPGLARSDSKPDLNPVALDLLARRRAFVKRINENVMRRVHSRKL